MNDEKGQYIQNINDLSEHSDLLEIPNKCTCIDEVYSKRFTHHNETEPSDYQTCVKLINQRKINNLPHTNTQCIS